MPPLQWLQQEMERIWTEQIEKNSSKAGLKQTIWELERLIELTEEQLRGPDQSENHVDLGLIMAEKEIEPWLKIFEKQSEAYPKPENHQWSGEEAPEWLSDEEALRWISEAANSLKEKTLKAFFRRIRREPALEEIYFILNSTADSALEEKTERLFKKKFPCLSSLTPHHASIKKRRLRPKPAH